MRTGKVKVEIYIDDIFWEPKSEECADIKRVILGDLDITDYLEKNGSMELLPDFIETEYDVRGAYIAGRQEKLADMNERYSKE